LQLKARDLVGYGVLQLLVLAPVALFLMWLLAHTFTYSPPVLLP
jgi:short-chain fatty acids transporter